MNVTVYDTTLREGAQSRGVWLTIKDKLRLLMLLDSLGVPYVEGGNPNAGEKERMFFREASALALQHTQLVAFGATRRHRQPADQDEGLRALLTAKTQHVCLFGKSWDYHVDHILCVPREENIAMIEESVAWLVSKGRTVFYDAEHFFDGYKSDPDYAMETLEAACGAGAHSLTLCDTNGGCFPDEISQIVRDVTARFSGIPIGIHCHNDTGMADANSIAAVRSGAQLVQATLGGFGERCGNANLLTQIADLTLKLGYDTIPRERLASLYEVDASFHEIANVKSNPMAPFVGRHAFAHKAGMHIDAVLKSPVSFEHIDPALVGARSCLLYTSRCV